MDQWTLSDSLWLIQPLESTLELSSSKRHSPIRVEVAVRLTRSLDGQQLDIKLSVNEMKLIDWLFSYFSLLVGVTLRGVLLVAGARATGSSLTPLGLGLPVIFLFFPFGWVLLKLSRPSIVYLKNKERPFYFAKITMT